MKKTIKQMLIVYLIIVILKILLSSLIPVPSAYSDEYLYMKLARSFFFDFNFSIHRIPVDNPPLYPIIISISYLFKDMNIVYFLMKVLNALVSSLIIIPAFLLAKQFFNEKKSLIISFLISIIPSNFSYSPYIISENLFLPLSLFAIYFLYKSFLETKYDYSILTGIFLAFSYLTRALSISLICAFVLSYFILFLFKKADRSILFKKFILITAFFVLIISPWVIRNFHLYGLHLRLLFGVYSDEATSIITDFKVMNYIIKFIVYTSYILLASLIIFPLKAVDAINKKNLQFSILLISFLTTTLIMVANHGRIVIFFDWFTGRYIGRYIDFLLPLIYIAGFIGVEKAKTINKFTMIIFAFLLAIGSLLTLHSLFPVNNLSLTWIGILKYFFEFVFYHKIDYSIEFFIGSLIFFALLFISLLFLVIFLLKKFSFKKLTPYFFIFFILLNLLNYGVIFYDSKTNWHNEEQMQLGMWLNDHDSDKISNILFDEESCGSLKKSNLGGICGGLDNTKTVIGYWLNDNIVVGNLSNTENIDYIISKYKLNYPIFYQTKNIFVYQVN